MMVRCLVVERNDEVMNPSNNYVPILWSIVWCACGRMSIPATHLSPQPNVITHPSDWSSRYLLCLKVIVHNLFPERRQGKTHQTKVHFGPWYTNDGDTEQQTEAKMREGNPDAPDKEPQHIHKHVDATTALRTINNMRTEWPQGKYAKLHRSDTKGNANDGDHQHQ